jgi:hypothetical protein
MGDYYLMAECGRTGLWKPSMWLKQAIFASVWDTNFLRESNSHSSVEKKVSHMELS